ncbi:GNAT family N-acetyltransferase [Pseudemcibacter aquimaris]|uniref:GNAT family N-acetyltransferase n=1 Tax=Pseudemcibacter aquimaris TaxID=2857064 RepID=UPI00237E378F|nr:GNAT family N-acetyltransferase [Pseudemcibacter aquimaris]WDU57855.1 GNAT family N-acetyltransferase [Pseudemcibacter aquimaris]
MSSSPYVIEPLDKHHNRAAFSCGNEALDRYLQKQASQDIKRNVSRVFILSEAGSPETVLGFYTLSALSIDVETLPETIKRKLPRHPLPAALLGRLAVSDSAHGTGIGKLLLADAIKRTMGIQGDMAIYAMVVDAIDDKAVTYYTKFGFTAFEDNPDRLFLPLKSIS